MILSEVSVRRPVLVSVIFFAITVFGAVSLFLLPIDLFPKIEPPVMSVITTYPGASAEEVEQKVTEVIEDTLGALAGLDEMTSSSKEGVSVVTLQFGFGADLVEASNEIRQNLEFAKLTLPKEAEPPILFQFDTSKLPVIMFAVISTRGDDIRGHRKLIEDRIIDPLKRVPGVGSVQLWNAPKQQLIVEVDRARLTAYGMTIGQVAQIIGAENFSIPAGHLDVGPQEFPVRMPAEFETLEDMERLVLRRHEDGVVRLGEVASVRMGYEEVREVALVNGQAAMVGGVQKRSGANTVQISERVEKEMERLRESLPDHLVIVPVFDTSLFIKRMITNLANTLLVAGSLVVAVVFVFLGRFRASAIVALAIPASILVVFVSMASVDYSLNAISMMAMCLAIGMVVDNAIVVLENISTKIDKGIEPKTAATLGAAEMGPAVLASTLTTVSVFAPLVFVGGLIGIMFGQLAFVISVTIAGSLFVALTLTPAMAGSFLRMDSKPNALARMIDRGMTLLARVYRAVLGFALRRRLVVIAAALMLLISTCGLASAVGVDFMPEQNSGELQITAELPIGTNVARTAEIGDILYQELSRQPEVEMIQYQAGTSAGAFGTAMGGKEGPNVVAMSARLIPYSQRDRTDGDVADAMRIFAQELPEIVNLDVKAGSAISGVLSGMGKPITIAILGDDFDEITEAAQIVKDILSSTKGTVDVSSDLLETRPELRYELDRDRASRLGVNAANVGATLRAALYGTEVSKYRGDGEDVPLVVRLAEDDRVSAQDLGRIKVDTASGGIVRLGDLGTMREAESPIEIRRTDQQRMLSVGANLQDRPMGDVVADVEKKLEQTKFPAGVTYRFVGAVEEQKETFQGVLIALGLGAMMVYLVMAGQFESYRDPLIIIFALPFSITGALLFLVMTNTTLSLPAFLGMIILLGVVVNNAIVLVDYVNQLRGRGMAVRDALMTAGERRLRPVLMTTITTVFGMVPLAWAQGEGSELWVPLGRAALGGMIVSAAVTLVLIPVLYTFAHRREAAKS
jgi:hydrophobic/amphiphilic exporter-1 (mainly G- bacteria), HAE1 family